MIKKSYWVIIGYVLALTLVFCMGLAISAEGDKAIKTASWNASSETDLAGYEIHYGRESQKEKAEENRDYTFAVKMDTRTEYPFVLQQGMEYFFALKAFDTSGNVSGLSDELDYVVPVIPEGDVDAPATPTTTINIQPGTNEVILNLP